MTWYAALRSRFGDDAYDIYDSVGESLAYSDVGDYLFASDLDLPDCDDYFSGIARSRSQERVAELLPLLRQLASQFLDEAAERLASSLEESTVVALSSTFTQTIPSLALIQKLSTARPDLSFVLGGANMTPERGVVLLNSSAALDAVCFGDGEPAIDAVMAAYDADEPPLTGPGVVARDHDVTRLPPSSESADLSQSGAPILAPYFEQLDGLGLSTEIEPRLSWEIARGCWWGEKRHCTFCGLNGQTMAFRRRPPARIARDLLTEIEAHHVLDVLFVDNILHQDDITDVFEKLPPSLDLRVHLEVKADLTFSQIQTLSSHGVWHLQPGIESLARRPLRLMRKGVTPMQNVRFLRHTEELGVSTTWNILTGFPTETDLDYQEMLDQITKLHHLQPPGSVDRLALVRHSPLFEDEEFGLGSAPPAETTVALWGDLIDPAGVRAMADVFTPPANLESISADRMAELKDATDEWKRRYATTTLREWRDFDRIVIARSAGSRVDELALLSEPWQLDLWEELRGGSSPTQWARRNGELSTGEQQRREELRCQLLADGLVYNDGGVMLALPTRVQSHLPVKAP